MIKRSTQLFFVVLILFHYGKINAQTDKQFTPNGKPLVLIFSNLNSSFNEAGNSKAFELTRAYLGYEYSFSKNISSKINIDVGDPGVGKLQMTAFLKNAYVQYKTNSFSARFGMISTDQFKIQEKQWGNRYVFKSFQDEHSFGPSADLGAGIKYSPCKFLELDMSVTNGEGYKKIEADSVFKTSAGFTVKPDSKFTIRGYVDHMKEIYAQTSVALFLSYSVEKFNAGAEYNFQKNNKMISNQDYSGFSVYTSMIIMPKINLFARYDYLSSVTVEGETERWNKGNDGQLFIVGFDYSPVKGVRIAPVYKGWSPYDGSMPFTSTIALNFEIKY